MENNRIRIALCGEWTLYYQKNSEYLRDSCPPITVEALCGRAGCISAQVPGNFEIDLQRAGLLPDLFYGQNILQAQKLESYHLFYGRSFQYQRENGTSPVLIFEGLDTVAEIFLNGQKIGECENMLVSQSFPLKKLREGENELVVHIFPACIAARGRKLSALNSAQPYNYESLRLRKSPSMFGWDIMPRLVSGGIWRPVYIEQRPREHWEQAYLMTQRVDPAAKTAQLVLFYEAHIEGDELSEYSLILRGQCGESRFERSARLWFTAGRLELSLENVQLWWPKGYGEQPLYEVELSFLKNGETLDVWHTRLGIRTVSLEHSEITDAAFSGKFQFAVNGQKIFILGTNFVPIDALHSRDRERLPKVLALLEETGCNAVRCWGGGVYEDTLFYRFCDEKGILVWQDFCMACGIYPTDSAFCEVMREEAEKIVKRLRQHPCLLLWAGDNECDLAYGWFSGRDPNGNRVTREVLKRVVETEDPVRPYLPSSPFIGPQAAGKPVFLPEDHLWGPRDYYKSDYYKNSCCSFASEIGYHGCPSKKSLLQFLPPEQLWPWEENDSWLLHAAGMETGGKGPYAYRIGLMAGQIKELFGFIPKKLEDFILASQISQAEAKKFFIELFRLGQPERTGIIWWNLIDGWPQFSDAVVDYYFRKKLAYSYIRQVQQPVLLAMKEPENWEIELDTVNDTGQPVLLSYAAADWETGREAACGQAEILPGVSTLCRLPYSRGERKLYTLCWRWEGKEGKSHYLAGNPPFSLEKYRAFLWDYYRFDPEEQA